MAPSRTSVCDCVGVGGCGLASAGCGCDAAACLPVVAPRVLQLLGRAEYQVCFGRNGPCPAAPPEKRDTENVPAFIAGTEAIHPRRAPIICRQGSAVDSWRGNVIRTKCWVSVNHAVGRVSFCTCGSSSTSMDVSMGSRLAAQSMIPKSQTRHEWTMIKV